MTEREQPNMNIPQQRANIPPLPPAQRVNVSVQPMTIEKLIGGYNHEEEEEEMLPGFRYLIKENEKMRFRKNVVTKTLIDYCFNRSS